LSEDEEEIFPIILEGPIPLKRILVFEVLEEGVPINLLLELRVVLG
jgi:hypothetical protein